MYLSYQNNKIVGYTEEPQDLTLYNLDKVEYTEDEYVLDGEEYVLKDEAWEEKQAQKEHERIQELLMPAIETMYVMPPTINYKPLGKGKQMTWDGEKFVAVDLGYPKSIECLLAVVGTKFGRVDWKRPVLGMLNGKLSLITEEQFNAGEASSIVLANDNLESIDTITFDPLTFELYFGGKVAQPVSALDVNADLAEVAGKGRCRPGSCRPACE